MSTHTLWVVDKKIPEVVAFVDSASEEIRAKFYKEQTGEMENDGGVIATSLWLNVWFCSECGCPTYGEHKPFYCQYCGVKINRD